MKTKLTFIGVAMIVFWGILTMCFFPTSLNSTQNSSPSFVTSRFMLFSGIYQVDSELKKNPSSTENGVFKIDTYTGSVWILKVTESSETRTEKWHLIESSPITTK